MGRRSTKAVVSCDNCGKEFEKHLSKIARSKNNFCSQECHFAHASNWIVVTCEQCGKPVGKCPSEISRYKHHFCSQKCYFVHQFNTVPNARVSCKCDYCGAEFERYPSLIKRREHVFCSQSCGAKFRWASTRGISKPETVISKQPKPTFICEQCGRPFARLESKNKHSNHLFCCKEHSDEWHRENGIHSGGRPPRAANLLNGHLVENATCYRIQARRRLEGQPVNKHCVELPETRL